MRRLALTLTAGVLATSLAACGKPAEKAEAPAAAAPTPETVAGAGPALLAAAKASAAAAGALEQPDLTVKDIMDKLVDPAGDYLFESVQDIADAKGVRRKQPTTDKDWAEVTRQWQVLHDAPRLLIQPGRKAGRDEDKPEHPEVENPPAEVAKLMAANPLDWQVRAQRLKETAAHGLAAAQAKDVAQLSTVLLELDKACESCHLKYYYPNDKRARQAAKEDGVIE